MTSKTRLDFLQEYGYLINFIDCKDAIRLVTK